MNRLPADVSLGPVRLRIVNLERSLEFYTGKLGLHVLSRSDVEAWLAASPAGGPIVALHAIPGTTPRPEYAIGLYHFAILFPDRPSLARAVLGLLEARWSFTGFADHGVSEAAYLSDPDGNGIELYADRPREAWPMQDGALAMFTRPLNLDGLLDSAEPAAPQVAADTHMGHIHLHVSSLERARAFYESGLGFDVTTDALPGALFLAAGGYHHHVGTNEWARRASPPNAAGLLEWTLRVPAEDARMELRQRLEAQGSRIDAVAEGWRVADADGNVVLITG
jgi:catechol 2,3-dioxygenase